MPANRKRSRHAGALHVRRSIRVGPRAHESYGDSGAANTHDIIGCAWAAGRWPGKGALEYRGEGDRVRLRLPDQLPAFTLIAWVRLDEVPKLYSSLVMCERNQVGAVHWALSI